MGSNTTRNENRISRSSGRTPLIFNSSQSGHAEVINTLKCSEAAVDGGNRSRRDLRNRKEKMKLIINFLRAMNPGI